MESLILAGSFKSREVLPGFDSLSPLLSVMGYLRESPGLACAKADRLQPNNSVSKAASVVTWTFSIKRR